MSAPARGRKPGFVMTEEHRVKIKNSNILNALIEHAEGRRDMSSTQVTTGLGLLKKVMPDLSSMALTGEDGGAIKLETTTVDASSMTPEERETMRQILLAAQSRKNGG